MSLALILPAPLAAAGNLLAFCIIPTLLLALVLRRNKRVERRRRLTQQLRAIARAMDAECRAVSQHLAHDAAAKWLERRYPPR